MTETEWLIEQARLMKQDVVYWKPSPLPDREPFDWRQRRDRPDERADTNA